jgi:hypothetical protein
MMPTLIAIGILIGAGVGLRFKVLMLVPTIVLAALGTTLIGISSGRQFWSVVGTAILIGTTIQIGYLVGVVTRAIVASVRVHKQVVAEVEKLGIL